MCRVLKVSPSGYYAWRGRPLSKRTQEDAKILPLIEKLYLDSFMTYGYRRIYKALIELEIRASRRRIARLMQQYGFRGRQYRRYVVTTKPGKRLPDVPDLVNRNFTASRPNEVWVADITYVRTKQGWLYLAVILDLFSRCIVGWSMQPSLSGELTLSALKMAWLRRGPQSGLIHHSDRGSQYTAGDYQTLLKCYHAIPSFGSVDSCFDNAAMESFFGTLKTEWLFFHQFETHQKAISSIFYYIEVFYNRKRLHSAIGYKSPLAFETEAENLIKSSVH